MEISRFSIQKQPCSKPSRLALSGCGGVVAAVNLKEKKEKAWQKALLAIAIMRKKIYCVDKSEIRTHALSDHGEVVKVKP